MNGPQARATEAAVAAAALAWVIGKDTVSAGVRATFRTDTAPGKVALCLAWGALTAAVIPHWMHQPD